LAQIRLVVFEINAPLILKNDVTKRKAGLRYLPVKKLLTGYVSFKLPKNHSFCAVADLCEIFFGFSRNTCSLQPALKSNAPGL